MNMRRTLAMVALLSISACATVTVQPASMTTSLAEEESQLTQTARAFTSLASDEGWVKPSSALTFLRDTFFGADEDNKTLSYTETLEAENLSKAEARDRIIADVSTALTALVELNDIADAAIMQSATLKRADISSYEDAMLTAVKVRSAFSDAQNGYFEKDSGAWTRIDTQILALADEISRSEDLADDLVAAWQMAEAGLTS